jgi:ribokinase
MASARRLAVLGSLNMDITVSVDRLPGPGATVLGSAARFTPGGKGANQAVAAARLLTGPHPITGPHSVTMAGCVGDDAFGAQLLAALSDECIDTGGVRVLPGTPSGIAMITVDATGENMITVAPGANAAAGDTELDAVIAARPDVLVISAEIPRRVIEAALTTAVVAPGTSITMLNLAPAPPEAAALISRGIDWLVVNESEAAAVLGHPVTGLTGAASAAAELATRGPRTAVVTAGAAGAAMAGEAGTATVPGFKIHAVDTVGAGDTFVGALAVAIAAGISPVEALRAASAAAATAATRPGAQSGMPRPADIEPVTGYPWPTAPNAP